MKTFLILLLSVGVALGADVTFNLVDILGTTVPIQRKTVRIEPLSTVRGNGNNVVVSERRFFSTGTNGTFTATNLNEGSYRVVVLGNTYTSVFRINVIDTNGALTASSILETSSTTALETEEGQTLDLE
jgi:hypothetical protein